MSTALRAQPDAYEEAELWADDDKPDTGILPSSALAAVSALDDASVDVEEEAGSRRLFDELADELAYAARGLSSLRLAYRHPAYLEIMTLGEQCIPWLLERLETPGDRPLWLRLLGSLTRFQPGAGRDTVPEAAAAWITWGKLRGAH
jgi:hypothetical protein